MDQKIDTDASNLNLLIVNSMIPHILLRDSVEKVSKFKENAMKIDFHNYVYLETKLIGEVNYLP